MTPDELWNQAYEIIHKYNLQTPNELAVVSELMSLLRRYRHDSAAAAQVSQK